MSLNPALRADHAKLDAAREKLPQARAGFFPRVTATADYSRDVERVSTPSSIDFNLTSDGPGAVTPNPATQAEYRTFPRGLGLQASLSLFDGGRTLAGLSEAHALIGGAAENAIGSEQETILATVAAYIAVQRATEVQAIRRRNATFLASQLSVLSARHRYGDVTGADVALTEARLADARSRLAGADAALAAARASYVRMTGAPPVSLSAARPLNAILPGSVDEAIAVAYRSNPTLRSVDHAIAAAKAKVRMDQADLLPTVSISAAVSRRENLQSRGDRIDRAYVMGRLSIPLFDGGLAAARTRESKAIVSQRQLERDAALELVRSTLVSDWAQLTASKELLASAERQVEAGRKAVGSLMQLYQIGERSLSDVLLGQQDLISAEENLANAHHDRILYSFAVARDIGILRPKAMLAELGRAASRPPRDGLRLDGLAPDGPGAIGLRGAACPNCGRAEGVWSLRGATGGRLGR